MVVTITTLCENTVGQGQLMAEWGLSFLVEADGATVLFDTGRETAAVYNADRLGIDLRAVDIIALSHGHYDHTGGLREVLRRQRRRLEIVAHPDVWAAKYVRDRSGETRYIGIPHTLEELEGLGADFNFSREPVAITENILTTGEIPLVTSYEGVGQSFFVKNGGEYHTDDIPDDMALIIKTPVGLVIVLGCAHRGIMNTIYHAQAITGVSEVHTVVGGSHLIGADEERLWWTLGALRELDIKQLGLCHCTGFAAACAMAGEFGERFIPVNTGARINVYWE